MTLKEVIKILLELHDQCCQADSIFCTDTTGARCEAVNMAISALQQQDLSNTNAGDMVSRQAAIDILDAYQVMIENGEEKPYAWASLRMSELPSVQPESCEYYALCRHGRDESKLRTRLGVCEYCNEDSDGYVKPIEKNNHAFVRFGMNGWELSLKANGWHGSAKIKYCPMCGRNLLVK